MTTEEQLKAIIAAQAMGGRVFYQDNGDGFRSDLKCWCEYHILEILLDPKGLRAAYGEDGKPDDPTYMASGSLIAAHRILDTWLSSNGDAAAAINRAFQLLP